MMCHRFGMIRLLRRLVGPVSRTSVLGSFAGVGLILVIFDRVLVPVFFKISCSLSVMFRHVRGPGFSFSCSRGGPKSLCARAMLRALVE